MPISKTLTSVLVMVITATTFVGRAYPAPPTNTIGATPENTRALCTDHLDNDFDGHEDCDDQDCQDFAVCAKPTVTNANHGVGLNSFERRSRATMRLVAGGILLGLGLVLFGTSGAVWWERGRQGDADDRRTWTIGAVTMDVAGAGLTAAGATLVTLGAGDAAALKLAATKPLLRADF